jgi:hypothetical protein
MTKKSACVLVILACWVSTALADPPGLTADDIIGKVLRTDAFSWEGARTRVRMILTDKDGTKEYRLMEILGRRSNGLMQTVVRFLEPQNIAGSAFLMLERKSGPSEQYIYLSGLKRTRRIVGREREGSFMGSDFTYADMQRIDTKQAKHTRLPDEKIGNIPVYVVESRIAPDADSAYSRVLTRVRKTDFIPLRTYFYDKKGKLLKALYARRVRKIEGNPVIMEARMQNKQTGHATELVIESLERKDDVPDTVFTPTALEHW